MNPRIGIVIPTYNKEQYVNQCIENLLKINYKNFKIIFINDGCTDNTIKLLTPNLDILKKVYGNNILLKELDTNKGIFHAEFEGIKETNDCEYVLLNAFDDLIHAELINRLLRDIENYRPNTHFSMPCAFFKDGKPTGKFWSQIFMNHIYEYLIHGLVNLKGNVNIANTLIPQAILLKSYTQISKILEILEVRLELGHDVMIMNHMMLCDYVEKVIPIYHTYVGYTRDNNYSISKDMIKRLKYLPIVFAHLYVGLCRKNIIKESKTEDYIIIIRKKAEGLYKEHETFMSNFFKYKEMFESKFNEFYNIVGE